MPKNKKNMVLKKIGLLFGLIILIFLSVQLFQFFKTYSPLVGGVIHPTKPLRMSSGRLNVLLLGIGGGSHDGPNLTDTIIYASIDPVTKRTTLISIPRDLWVPDLQGKANTAYALGQENGQQKGLVMAKAAMSKIIGQPIDYAFRIDFAGFVKAIDYVGGIDVTVANALDDYEYPIDGKEEDTCGHTPEEMQTLVASDSSALQLFPCRYMHLHFDKGLQHMDGNTALMFVRSRHGTGAEGTDFARSRRQQLVIEAFRSKVLSLQIALNPVKIIGLYSILKDSIDTDVSQDEFGLFIRFFQQIKSNKIESTVIDFGDAAQNRPGLLINPPISSNYDFASVLLPRIGDGNFSEIQDFVKCEITKGACMVSDQSKQ